MHDSNESSHITASSKERSVSAAGNRDETAPATPRATPSGVNFSAPVVATEVGTLGPYRVVKELGKGGMGAVYLAVDTRLNRKLALKVMLPEFAADHDARDRFLREARTAAQITHDNVVTVYEADERGGVPYMAMQFLQGSPLDEFLRANAVPPLATAVRIAYETSLGLAAAHELELVHRDIKPANLWLEAPHGRVKILDFGLAKPVEGDAELTRSGAVVGTPAFMSPEQARGLKVDHRTDLFSLGAVLYRLCTGKNPFTGPSTMAVLVALGTEEPVRVSELNPAVPEPLARLVHRLLAKRPEDRLQTATEVAEELRAILRRLPAPGGAPPDDTAALPGAAPSGSHPVVLEPQTPQPTSLVSSDPGTPGAAQVPANGKKWPWLVAGAALVAAVAVAVAVVLRPAGTKEEAQNPPVLANPGGAQPAPPPPVPAPVAAPTPVADQPRTDRAVARWALSLGGAVQYSEAGKEKWTNRAVNLPLAPFVLRHVYVAWGEDKVNDDSLAQLRGTLDLTILDLSNTDVGDHGLAHLKELRDLGRLWLGGTRVTGAGLKNLSDLTRLTRLSLQGTGVTDEGLEHLKPLAALECLQLGRTKVTDAGLKYLSGLKELRVLDLRGTGVSDAGLKHLEGVTALTRLDLRGTGVTAAGVQRLREVVPKCRIIADVAGADPRDVDRDAAGWALSVGGFVARRDSVAALGSPSDEVLPESIQLIHINLSVAGTGFLPAPARVRSLKELSDAGFEHLEGLTALDSLYLGDNPHVGNGALSHLKGVTSLQKLSIHGTGVTDAGLEHLKGLTALRSLWAVKLEVNGEGLKHLKDLKELSELGLSDTKMTDTALAHLAPLSGLRVLSLERTPVTDAGLDHLAKLRGLTMLALRETKVTKAGIQKLAKALPRCKIEHDGGVVEPNK